MNDSDRSLTNIIRKTDLDNLFEQCLLLNKCKNVRKQKNTLKEFIISLCNRGYDVKQVFREYTQYLITNRSDNVTDELLRELEFLIHHNSHDTILLISYFNDECCKLIAS